MGRAKHRRANERYAERFAALPLAVLTHQAFTTLRVGHQRVLWLLAAEFDGTNNGNLALTRNIARRYGLNNERHRTLGLRELEHRELIVRATTISGLTNTGVELCTLYALAWRPIQYWERARLVVPRPALQRYLDWSLDTHGASVPTRTKRAVNRRSNTHLASGSTNSPTRTEIAPSENLGGITAGGVA